MPPLSLCPCSLYPCAHLHSGCVAQVEILQRLRATADCLSGFASHPPGHGLLPGSYDPQFPASCAAAADLNLATVGALGSAVGAGGSRVSSQPGIWTSVEDPASQEELDGLRPLQLLLGVTPSHVNKGTEGAEAAEEGVPQVCVKGEGASL